MQLRQGTLLQGGKYRIVSTLGQGGFGITYLAEQPMLERRVCIKEFFFKEYCEREEATSHVTINTKSNAELVERFRKKFVKEARVISKLHHDHIIQIHDIFEENATAYYVMDYVEGESLGDMIKRVGFLPEQQALAYISDVADALAYIHSKSINHLDVKPGNIMLRREDHRILLIDFGVSKQYDQDTFEGTTTTPVGISHGYSPAEQYRKNGVQSFSPQSDVYALAATLYKMLTGVTPPEAIEVQDEGLPLVPLNAKNVSSSTITAIVNAMKSRTQRTQNIGAFLADLNGDVEVTVVTEPKKDVPPPNPSPSPSPSPSPTSIPHPSPKPSPLKRYLLMAVVIIAVIAGAVVYLNRGDEPKIVKDYPVMANDGSVIYKWTGELSDLNLPTGKGIATFASGDKQSRKEYRGEMNSGSFESSNATLLYTNGSKFEGSFKNGMRAEGTFTITQDGMYYKGTYLNDKEYNGKWYFLGSDEVYSEVVNGTETSKPAKPAKPINQPAKPANPRPTTGTLNGYDWVDLGLSVKWATQNVGASSPSDYGYHFAWGETETKSRYDWSNCFDCLDSKGDSWGTYKIGGKTSISPTSGHDTARENWGSTWRMPTEAEFEELSNKCEWTWTSQGGHNGYKVTDPNGNSIFLPAASLRYGTGRRGEGRGGHYWSSTLSSSGSRSARCLLFNSSGHGTNSDYRSVGQSVRPVTD